MASKPGYTKMRTPLRLSIKAAIAILTAVLPARVDAIEASLDEMLEARRFVAAKLKGTEDPKWSAPVLLVRENHGPAYKNARGGQPLRIVDAQYTRGLYCHANSQIEVRLTGPGKTFSAVVGLDSNNQTRPGRGSVVFSVAAAAKELFRSDVIREGMPGVAVQVDLSGATEFVLKISDSGDGISHDQADWADAQVELAASACC